MGEIALGWTLWIASVGISDKPPTASDHIYSTHEYCQADASTIQYPYYAVCAPYKPKPCGHAQQDAMPLTDGKCNP